MRRFRLIGAVAALLVPAFAAAERPPAVPHAGDVYEILVDREMSEKGDNGSTGSSTDRDGFVERVVAVRPGGVELEFDLPDSTPAESRADAWQFPARVRRAPQGPMQLVNRADLAARVDGWLKRGGMDRSICGHWIFTWNGFHIDCDPESVIGPLERLDLDAVSLRDGGSFKDPMAREAVTLRRKAGREGETFVAEMAVDPNAVRRELAQTDVALGEIMRKPVTLESALAARAKAPVSGTITVTFDTDPAGEVRRRTKVTKLEFSDGPGVTKSRTTTETVDRRLVRRGGS